MPGSMSNLGRDVRSMIVWGNFVGRSSQSNRTGPSVWKRRSFLSLETEDQRSPVVIVQHYYIKSAIEELYVNE